MMPFLSETLGSIAVVCFLSGCTSPEREKTTVKMDVFANMEFRVVSKKVGDDSLRFVEFGKGDSTIFLYSESTDYGQEASGYGFCFNIDGHPDSQLYSQHGKQILIMGYGTGMAPKSADTIRTYDFKVSILPGSIRIAGKVGDKNITGTYLPK
jgi:hypothetical protein